MLPELETDRMMLRELALEDAPAIQPWQNSPLQWRHMAIEPADLVNATARIATYLEYRGNEPHRMLYVYAARLKSDGALIGSVSLQRCGRAIANLGLSVAASHGGRGYATELARRMLAFGFGELRLHRIAADVAVQNQPCLRVMEKIGMRPEGVARECIFAQDRWWTEARFAMLATDDAACGAQPVPTLTSA